MRGWQLLHELKKIGDKLPQEQYYDIKYKFIPSQQLTSINLAGFPRISIKDPMLKKVPCKYGDVIAIYRDYELNVEPYYYYRIVT